MSLIFTDLHNGTGVSTSLPCNFLAFYLFLAQEIIAKSQQKNLNFNLNFKYLFTQCLFGPLFLTTSTCIIYIINHDKTFVKTYTLADLGIVQ